MMTRVEQLWQEISSQSGRPGLFQRVDEDHPLDLYAGVDYQGKRVLMLVTEKAPPSLPPAGVVEITCNQRADREFAIILQLARQEYDEIFGRLCQDLVDATRDATPENGGDAILRRLSRWRKLLEVGQRTTLSETELRGLIGELWFLRSVALDRVGVDAAVKGWVGPLDAPQDFVLGETVVEIKTSSPGVQKVSISSLQQLDAGSAPLYLGVIWVAPADQNTADAFSAAQLVRWLRDAVEASPVAGVEFELRLAEAGYADHEEYERIWYRVTQARYFQVRDDFPRLIREGAPAGMLEATYIIDLGACGVYESPLP
jgi:hypothetical protein